MTFTLKRTCCGLEREFHGVCCQATGNVVRNSYPAFQYFMDISQTHSVVTEPDFFEKGLA